VPHVKNGSRIGRSGGADAVAGHLMGLIRCVICRRAACARTGAGLRRIGEIEISAIRRSWTRNGTQAVREHDVGGAQSANLSGALKKPFEWSLRTPLATFARHRSPTTTLSGTYAKEHMSKVRTSDWGRLFAVGRSAPTRGLRVSRRRRAELDLTRSLTSVGRSHAPARQGGDSSAGVARSQA
jgi:hypothetical protein